MTTLEQAAYKALEALNRSKLMDGNHFYCYEAANALRQALEQPVCASCPYLEIHDAVVKDNDKATALLRQCLEEMRYAGWNKFESDNTARNGIYEQVQEFLK